MSVPARRPLVAAFAVALAGLAGTALSGCSNAPSIDRTASIAGMLQLVPDTPAARRLTLITLYDRADRAVGAPSHPTTAAAERARVARLVGRGRIPLMAFGPALRNVDPYRPLGFTPSAVRAEIWAGGAPDDIDVAVGDFKRQHVLSHASQTRGATRPRVAGRPTVRWLQDQATDPRLDTPVAMYERRAGRIGFERRGVLAYAGTDRSIRTLMRIGNDPEQDQDEELHLLAGAPGLADVADGLDTRHVYAAELRSTVLRGTSGGAGGRVGPSRPVLVAPYRAIGFGAAGRWDHPRLVVVIAHADEHQAERNAAALRRGLRDGDEVVSGRPWRRAVLAVDVHRYGTTIVASFVVVRGRLTYDRLATEPLFAVA